MKLKEMLEDIKMTVKESSNRTKKELEEIKLELETVTNKLSSQNSRIISFINKIDDLKQINLETATLIEEMAFTLLEENPKTILKTPDTKEISINTNNNEQKYIN